MPLSGVLLVQDVASEKVEFLWLKIGAPWRMIIMFELGLYISSSWSQLIYVPSLWKQEMGERKRRRASLSLKTILLLLIL